MHRFGAFLLLAAAAAAQVPAQPKPLRLGNVTFQGSLRTRVEAWDWFEGAGNNAYAFSGNILRFSFSRQQKLFDWQVEFAAPLLFGLPDDAIAPARAEAPWAIKRDVAPGRFCRALPNGCPFGRDTRLCLHRRVSYPAARFNTRAGAATESEKATGKHREIFEGK